MNTRRTSGRQRRGAAMIEFVLVLIPLLLFVWGVTEFGRAMMMKQILTNGAREGARRAVLAGATSAQAQQTMTTYLNNAGISGGFTTQVSPDPASTAAGSAITVTITLPFTQVFSVPTWAGMTNVNLAAVVVMRKE